MILNKYLILHQYNYQQKVSDQNINFHPLLFNFKFNHVSTLGLLIAFKQEIPLLLKRPNVCRNESATVADCKSVNNAANLRMSASDATPETMSSTTSGDLNSNRSF